MGYPDKLRRYLRAGIAALAATAMAAATLPLGPAAQAAGGTGTYAAWTAPTGSPPTSSGTFSLPGLFPDVTAAAQSRAGINTATLGVASSATLSSSTPFGARFGSSLRKQYLNIGGAITTSDAEVVLTFNTATPANRWGFALGDVDAESVLVTASNGATPLTEAQLGWQGGFNYAGKGIVPTWDSDTSTLTGSGNNTDGESGWFVPTVPVTSVTLRQKSLTGFPSYQLWLATDDTAATPLCNDGPQPDGSEVVCFLGGTSTWTVPSRITNIDYLIVGGGGGGGADNGGGGGGGGMLTGSASVTPGNSLSISVGAGGAAGTGVHPNSTRGGDGGPSSLSITGGALIASASGGGGGGAGQVTSTGVNLNPGRPGGSGGGGAGESSSAAPGGSGVAGQGTSGGAGASVGGGGGGGGGGAASTGLNGSGKAGGNGGAGRTSTITGRTTTFAGGGGGAGDLVSDPQGLGGLGGGGNAGNPATPGMINTGGGGGGGSYDGSSSANGASGGSGIVVIRYIATPFNVSYNANGGSGAPSSTTAFAGDTFGVSVTQPTRTGYTFASWNTEVGGGGASYVSGATFPMPSENVTLYAQWTPVPRTLSYDENGGTGAPASSTFGFETTATAAPPGAMSRTGFWFNGWNTVANGTGTAYAAGATFLMPNSDVTLFAQWVAVEFRVVYSANGGTDGPADQVAATATTVTVATPGSMTRTGYTFTAWNELPDGTGTSLTPGSSFSMPPSNTTLYAQWSPIPYTLLYNGNGGDPVPSFQIGQFQEVLAIPSALPVRSGYTFTGWNTAANGTGTTYAPGGSILMPAANVTLYAQWFAETNTLNYSANGGINSPPSELAATGTSVTVSSQVPSRSGFTFGGWSTSADGSGLTYAPAATLVMPGENLTLFARWQGLPGPDPETGPGPAEPTPAPTPIPTPIPTPTPSPSPSVDKPFITEPIRELPVGQAIAYEGSQTVAIQVSSSVPDRSQSIQGDDWSLNLTAFQPNGSPAALTSSGAIDATAGADLLVSGTGFAPGSIVNVFLIDPAQPIGTFRVAADGTFRGTIPVPAGLAPGRYVVQANGTTPNAMVRSTSVGILIGGSAATRKAKLRATVYFDVRSAKLDRQALRKIARLARKIPKESQIIRVRSVGYVQPESFTANDQRLSTKRARNVVRQLRKDGVRGPTVIRGNGQAKEKGAKARRATVTVTYRVVR